MAYRCRQRPIDREMVVDDVIEESNRMSRCGGCCEIIAQCLRLREFRYYVAKRDRVFAGRHDPTDRRINETANGSDVGADHWCPKGERLGYHERLTLRPAGDDEDVGGGDQLHASAVEDRNSMR